MPSFKQQLQAVLDRATSPEVLEEVGALIVQRLKERVRGGQAVKKAGGNPSSLKPLSNSYIRQRARDPNLSPETSPSKSNLTRYGDMLDSLTYYVDSRGNLVVTVKGEANVRKAIYTSVDRPWANLSKADITAIQKIVRSKLTGKD
jgi:hypothetical protein